MLEPLKVSSDLDKLNVNSVQLNQNMNNKTYKEDLSAHTFDTYADKMEG